MNWLWEKLPFIRDELAYGSRLAWIRTKDVLGLSRGGLDRSFYIAQLARKLRSGELGRNVRITAAGKTDGAGAQAHAKISAIAFAAAFGLDYVHSPFRVVCHAEGRADQWAQSWEKTLNLGHGHSQIESCGLPVILLGDFLKDRSLWRKGCVVQLIHFQNWTNSNPGDLVSVAPSLRDNYYRDKERTPNGRRVVAVHIRRGDVSETRSAKTHFTPNSAIAATLDRVVALLRQRGEAPSIRIFSQGVPEDFKEFAAPDVEFYLDRPAIWTFHQLVEADVLIMARSSFSFVAGVLCEGIKLYDPFRDKPLPHWIVRDAKGGFQEAIFSDQLDLLRTSHDPETVSLS